jgi:hypothetical protein
VIVIWGHRWYGQAFPREGQGIATRGFHIYYVPLIPLGQMWITQRGDGMVRGMTTRWSWRAAMPVFAFQWSVIGALIASASPVVGLPLVAGAIALGVWGFRGSHPRGKREQERRELTAAVLGTGCPPELIERGMLRELAPRLDTAWGQVSPDRSPEDCASLGPRDRREAALAYTLLTVRGHIEGGGLAKTLHDQAGRVLDALERTPMLPQGDPYRGDVLLPEQTAD